MVTRLIISFFCGIGAAMVAKLCLFLGMSFMATSFEGNTGWWTVPQLLGILGAALMMYSALPMLAVFELIFAQNIAFFLSITSTWGFFSFAILTIRSKEVGR